VKLADGQVVRATSPQPDLKASGQVLSIRPHRISNTPLDEASAITVQFGTVSYLGDRYEQDATIAGETLRLTLDDPMPVGEGTIWIRMEDATVFDPVD
jgi:hypothetical protein